MKNLLLILTLALALPAARFKNPEPWPCQADAERLCRGVTPGEGRIVQCLKEHREELSRECRAAASEHKPPQPPRQQPAKPRWNAPMNAVEYDRPEPGENPRNMPPPQASGLSDEKVEAIIDKAVEKAVQKKEKEAVQAKKKEKTIVSDVDTALYQTVENPDNFALVIGIDKYSDLPAAAYAERDAAAMREHLLALGYPERNIVSLIGQKAGKASFLKNIDTWLARNVNAKSTVFVYYSGHGAPDPKTGQAYLLPWDGDPQFLEDTAYPVKRLYEKLGALKAKQVIVALDACFSGAGGRSVLAKGVRPLVNKIDTGALKPGKIISLSASAGHEISGSVEDQGHGAFTYYLLKGLNGAARDENGRVTVQGLYDYLVPNVQDAARRQNRDQTPQLMPPSSGGLVLSGE